MTANCDVYFGENGYLDLISDILEHGVPQTDRTGVGTISLFDAKVVYPEDEFGCFSTVKPASLRMAFEELWFFLRGETDTKKLEAKGINFWKGNTSREFLDKCGKNYLKEGDLGRAYSKQFRDYGWDADSDVGKVDQLVGLIADLKKDPYSRRLMVDLWNPAEHSHMCLTPCWFNFQVVVIGEYLHFKLRNRSLDSVFGYSFAVQQYRLLQLCLCKMFGYKLGVLSADLSHVHIYNNQIDYAKELIKRDLGKQGEVVIKKELNTLEDLLSLEWEDFEVVNLEVNNKPFVAIRPDMAV
jgi:thymidylate synthase